MKLVSGETTLPEPQINFWVEVDDDIVWLMAHHSNDDRSQRVLSLTVTDKASIIHPQALARGLDLKDALCTEGKLFVETVGDLKIANLIDKLTLSGEDLSSLDVSINRLRQTLRAAIDENGERMTVKKADFARFLDDYDTMRAQINELSS